MSVAPLLEVQDLKVFFPVKHGFFRGVRQYVRAVDGISFTLSPAQTLGVVGESGCGKTTLGRAITRLIPPTAGRILFDGDDLTSLNGARLRSLRRKFQIIFQ